MDAVNDTSAARRGGAVRTLFGASLIREAGEARLAAFLTRLHGEYAPLEFHHAEAAGRVLHVFARTRGAHGWRDFQFRYEESAPHALLHLAFVADVAEPVYLPNGALDDPATLAWLSGYIEKLVREEDLSGAVLLARGDRTIYQRSFGAQDSARKIPITADRTRFNLGSGNKMFTALAVLSLVEEGVLRLDQTIADFLPDFPDSALARRITIAQLLAHSSGLGDYWTPSYERDGWRAVRIEETVPFVYAEFRERGPYFPPGAEHRYSNSGYLLLGRILERATGEDYYDLVRKRIYEPLGMSRSDHYLMDGGTPDLAVPWAKADSAAGEAAARAADRWKPAPHGLRGTSAGGGFSTCADMLRFARGLVAGRIVSRETLAAMTRPQPPFDPDDPQAYGLGFLLDARGGRVRSFGHGGIARGVNFELRYFPDQDVTLIAFCNQDNGAYDDLRRNLEKLVTGDR